MYSYFDTGKTISLQRWLKNPGCPKGVNVLLLRHEWVLRNHLVTCFIPGTSFIPSRFCFLLPFSLAIPLNHRTPKLEGPQRPSTPIPHVMLEAFFNLPIRGCSNYSLNTPLRTITALSTAIPAWHNLGWDHVLTLRKFTSATSFAEKNRANVVRSSFLSWKRNFNVPQ